jgi:phenylpyruvate tautomerase PptA (4-oxalocrotonate tautomerase family)
MPWVNITLRRGALSKEAQHAMVARLTSALMWWEKIPDNPVARNFMKAWVYEVAEDADYVAGRPDPSRPSYYLEVIIPANRLTSLDKRGIINDFTKVVLEAEGSQLTLENMHRVWVIITEIETDNWGIGGHRDWLRSYTSALDEVGRQGRGP